MIKVILWDIDGTLLNFQEAEKNSLRQCFSLFGLGECPDDQVRRYSETNLKYWRKLEKGEITRPQVLLGRFEEFFAAEGIQTDIKAFNQAYLDHLEDTICFVDQSYELIQELKGRVKQYAVTNGNLSAQERKLAKSGLVHLLDDVFISEQIGWEKPNTKFFDYVFDRIGSYEKDEIMIVGDSLTSDMRGGNLAGIPCCWYNPEGKPVPDDLKIDYNIQNLNQIREILALS